MKRASLALIAATTLAACAAPDTRSVPPAPVEAPAPFTIPMDPGAIACPDISNPAALVAATEWALGNARAAALSGQISAVPTAQIVSTNIAQFCAANPGATVRAAGF